MTDRRPYHSCYIGGGTRRTEPWSPLAGGWFWQMLFRIVLAGAATVLWGRSDATHWTVAILTLALLFAVWWRLAEPDRPGARPGESFAQ